MNEALETNWAGCGIDYGHGMNAFQAAKQQKETRKPKPTPAQQEYAILKNEREKARGQLKRLLARIERGEGGDEAVGRIDALRECIRKASERITFEIATGAKV